MSQRETSKITQDVSVRPMGIQKLSRTMQSEPTRQSGAPEHAMSMSAYVMYTYSLILSHASVGALIVGPFT